MRGRLELRIIVLMLESNSPGTASPRVSYPRLSIEAVLAISNLVVPVFSDNALAICLTRLSVDVLANSCSAPRKSPFLSSSFTGLDRSAFRALATLESSLSNLR